jgi:hypothetical protein
MNWREAKMHEPVERLFHGKETGDGIVGSLRTLALAFSISNALSLVALPAWATVIGYGFNENDDKLWRFDLDTGIGTAIGNLQFTKVRGMSFHPITNILHGVDLATDTLIIVDLNTGQGSVVVDLDVDVEQGAGLAFDLDGNLFLSDEASGLLYSIDASTGISTALGSMGQSVVALAFQGSTLFGAADDPDHSFVTLDTTTGAATIVGLLGISDIAIGMDADEFGNLWAVFHTSAVSGTIDPNSGVFTTHASLNCPVIGCEISSLAVVTIPEPSTLSLFATGLAGLGFVSWRRRKRVQLKAA